MRIDLSYFLYPELLPTGTEPENHGTVPRYLGEYHGGFAGDGDAVLLLFVHSAVHGIYQCRPPLGRYFFFFDFVTYGRFRQPGIAHQYLWLSHCRGLCGFWPDHRRYRRFRHRTPAHGGGN